MKWLMYVVFGLISLLMLALFGWLGAVVFVYFAVTVYQELNRYPEKKRGEGDFPESYRFDRDEDYFDEGYFID